MDTSAVAISRTNGTSSMIEVVAYDRAREAHRLRLSGLDWDTIAERTGYASGRIAKLRVTAYLQKVAVERAPEERKQDLQLEVDRLDVLGAAFWGPALAGDRHAANIVLKIIAQRSALLGLDRGSELDNPEYIVIGGTPEEYTAGLKAVVEQEEREKEQGRSVVLPSS